MDKPELRSGTHWVYGLSLRIVPEKFEAELEGTGTWVATGRNRTRHPPPPFCVSVDSKGLSVNCKPFKMNTCEDFLEVFILKGLRGQKNR